MSIFSEVKKSFQSKKSVDSIQDHQQEEIILDQGDISKQDDDDFNKTAVKIKWVDPVETSSDQKIVDLSKTPIRPAPPPDSSDKIEKILNIEPKKLKFNDITNIKLNEIKNVTCTKVFQFSGYNSTEKAYFKKFCSENNIKIVDGARLHPETTHLIIKVLKKNPKFLGAILRGIWIMNEEYLEQCIKNGRILKVILAFVLL